MGTFARVMGALLLVAVVVAIGSTVYNAGVTAGLAEAAQQAAAAGDPVALPPYGYGYGYGPYWHGPWGFGFFGFIFLFFGIFLVIGLVRAVFGWGRGGGPRGPWGRGGRREMFEAMHRDLHRGDGPDAERAAGT